MRKIINVLISVLFLWGCSTVNLLQNFYPDSVEVLENLTISITPGKIVYSGFDKTIYILDFHKQQINIYKKGIKTNVITGNRTGRFLNLSDIGISPDAKLLALDSDAAILSKYDSDGFLIADYDLSDFRNPTYFDVSQDETLFFYDNSMDMIVAYDLLSGKELFRFGEFELNNPMGIYLSKQRIAVHDESGTATYSKLGQFLDRNDAKIFYDNGNQFSYDEGRLLVNQHQEIELSKQWESVTMINQFLIMKSTSDISIGKIMYEKTN